MYNLTLTLAFVFSLLGYTEEQTQEPLAAGAAAHYSQSYDTAWWERTMRQYESWGRAIFGWEYDPSGFYCVRPGKRVGEVLWLKNRAGVSVSCTIGDTVQDAHVDGWLSRWVIEVNWDLFTYLALQTDNYVEVFETAPARYFAETGHTVAGEFLGYWSRFGDDAVSLEIFGFPISESYVESGSGLLIQKFERAVMELQRGPGGEFITLRRVVALAEPESTIH